MNNELTLEQSRQIKAHQKRALAGAATAWRPKALWLSPEEVAEFKRRLLFQHKMKMKQSAGSGSEMNEQ